MIGNSSSLTKQGIRSAVAQHDTPALFDWLSR